MDLHRGNAVLGINQKLEMFVLALHAGEVKVLVGVLGDLRAFLGLSSLGVELIEGSKRNVGILCSWTRRRSTATPRRGTGEQQK